MNRQLLQSALNDRYSIERELGEGGMATVYLAEDLRHRRRVALKVLRPELAAVIGADRFLAEIRTTANLQHPHILPLFDSGSADSLLYYVMPYVEGESLRDRLNREKQLPVAEAVRIAKEVASALDYAHRHGVIHRDIKPGNILLHDGQALVADFGIALALRSAGTDTRMTETGMSLGTPHYMSPEQAMGEREVTARSDIYALGAVTYEMLVGEPPFTGPTAQSIVAKVLTEEPRPLIPKRHTIPPHVEAVVLRALEKLAADRFATGAEFAAALDDATLSHRAAPAAAGARAAGSVRTRRPLMVLGAAAALLALLNLWQWLWPERERAVRRYGLALPEGQRPDTDTRMLLSPDGTRIVFAGMSGARPLWMKHRSRHDAVALAGTEGVSEFTFSPDGEFIAFVKDGWTRKLALSGGVSVALGDSASASWPGITWAGEHIYYVQAGGGGLRQVAADGGTSRRIWTSDSSTPILPVALPGSRHLLFTDCRGGVCGTGQDLWSLDLTAGRARPLLAGVASATYVAATRSLLIVRRDGTMLAMPFDAGRAELKGSPVAVLDSVVVLNGVAPAFSVSETGSLIVTRGDQSETAQHEIVWLDRKGAAVPLDSGWIFRHAAIGANAGWAISPDGRRLAIGLATRSGDDIWVKELPRGPLSRISFDTAAEFRPRWMPDGHSVQYVRGAAAGSDNAVYRRAADGSGSEALVADPPRNVFEAAWTRDGRWLLLRTGGVRNQVGGRDIVGLPEGKDTTLISLVASSKFDESAIALSPDGRWIAYQSDETGRPEVYLRPFPAVDSGRWQVSREGGTAPLWAPDGRALYFVSGDRHMIQRAVRAAPRLELGDPVSLFALADEVYLLPNENYTPFDISPDGQRFLMARRVGVRAVARSIVLTENWFTELRQALRR